MTHDQDSTMIGYPLLVLFRRWLIAGAAVLGLLAAPLLRIDVCCWSQNGALAQVLKNGTKIEPPKQPLLKPAVVLSAEHRKLCRVVVGDALPDITLPDGDGKQQEVRKLLGKKLTVVVFWNAEHRYALAEFRHLRSDVLKPFAKRGVAVVAIHVGTPPANYKDLVRKYGEGIVCLTDADRSAFEKVAKGKLPRTYLLDSAGKILWLDLEYSRTTRFDLRNAIRYYTKP